MALHTLSTQVDALIDRVVVLEPLAIAQVTAGTVASKRWMFESQTFPYWTNRLTRLTHAQRRDRWDLLITMRLILSHGGAVNTGSTPPQDLVWKYAPETLTYFEAVRTTLAPTGYAEIAYIDSDGLTITCPRGEDMFFNPYIVKAEWYYIEFEMLIPFSLMGV